MRKKIILITAIIIVCICAILFLENFEGDYVKGSKTVNQKSTKIYLKGDIGQLESNDINQVIDFLCTSKKIGQNINAKEEFILKNKEVDSIGFTHYKLQQVVKGVPVYNGELIVHVKKNNTIYLINGNYHKQAKEVYLNFEELLEKSELEKKAVEAIDTCEMKKGEIGEKLIYNHNGEYTLVYEVKVYCLLSADKIYRVFIDGYTGEVYDYYNIVMTK
ncbi:PepSY domain-containing protein [Oceanirhabdus sp. W0125-5]|uniref:PepSY domain-containing protein n=1 Tax=Oceanirhabdus sp. W0125-5 TaxID=2999116 RepID=UPI0022F2ED03|nr:PepSY domain-containing protein [Oceanirhabdus sp. W0125-5]WBW98730.1 PepSY domain-containing protein [Oceanirhabdus sp. W0125-5]